MPRFDNLAAAAITPGGFQAGVNDMVQAILGKQAGDKKLAAQQEQQNWQRGMAERELGMKEKTFGATMADNLADRNYKDQALGLDKERLELDRKKLEAAGDPKQPRPLTSKEQLDEDEAYANLQVFGTSIISEKGIPSEIEEEVLSPWGAPTGRKVKKPSFTPIPDDKKKQKLLIMKQRQDARNGGKQPGASIVQSLVQPSQGQTDGMSLNEHQIPLGTSTVPGGMGGQIAGAIGAQPPIDFDAWDAKLQASDPEYKQLRADPKFDWKADIADGIATGDYK